MNKPDTKLAEVFPGRQFRSHMPFFDGEVLLFCQSHEAVQREFRQSGSVWRRLPRDQRLQAYFQKETRTIPLGYRAWKLYYCEWADRLPVRLKTGLGADAIECSPAFYQQDGLVHVSFIGGEVTSQKIVYHLYAMSGPSWDELSPPQRVLPLEARMGFVSPKHICLGNRDLLLQERASGRQFRLSVPLNRLYRVTFRADDPESLLLTGQDDSGNPLTLQHHLEEGITSQVVADVPIYKSTIFEDQLIAAVKEGHDFENRQLKSGSYTLKKLRANNTVECTELDNPVDLSAVHLSASN